MVILQPYRITPRGVKCDPGLLKVVICQDSELHESEAEVWVSIKYWYLKYLGYLHRVSRKLGHSGA
jgi:hypothetical protein